MGRTEDSTPQVRRAVSRETSRDASASGEATSSSPGGTPEGAAIVFGQRLALAQRYVELLAGPGIERGLIGPREGPRLWQRHVLNCAVVHEALPTGCSVADVGSGAGLPGVVLAVARPDLHVTLVEPLLRRSRFLEQVAGELELHNTVVVRARAEDLAGQLDVQAVTARAVAPLEQLARWTFPLLSTAGRLLALKGASAVDEVARAAPALRRMGAVSWAVHEFGRGIVDPATRVAVIEVGPAVREAGLRRRRKGGR
ncbi:MAG TPA: 16S rRNA (guanine(527)-N(7))-methyltransferase RsmG [Jiangellaceae bacterium]|nr:16S rRNA (guanine(527)-N(7))-methyltransferase RsmG [Jiangellaceae bacterium]